MPEGWKSPIEERISDWVEEQSASGEIPEGAGEPIDLSDYFATPEAIRAGYALLKSNGFCPAEVELLRQIHALESRLKSEADLGDDEVTRWRRELTEARAKLGWQGPPC